MKTVLVLMSVTPLYSFYLRTVNVTSRGVQVNVSSLSTNIPVVSDTPWVVGGSHRNDFGNALVSRVCVMLSGGACLEPFGQCGSSGRGVRGAGLNLVK